MLIPKQLTQYVTLQCFRNIVAAVLHANQVKKSQIEALTFAFIQQSEISETIKMVWKIILKELLV